MAVSELWRLGGTRRRRARLLGRSARHVDTGLLVAGGVLGLLILVAIVAPFVLPNASTGNLGEALQAPSWAHPMGTDDLGRDMLARFCVGARVSLAVAAIVVVGGSLLGGLLGITAGVSSKLDGGLMRSMDAVLAFPPLILAMAITVGLGVGLVTATIGIMIASIPWYARLVRGEVLRIRSMPFVEATVALGATRERVVRRHVVPHLTTTLFIQGAAIFGYA